MKNFRLRIQLIAITTAAFNIVVWVIIGRIWPHPTTAMDWLPLGLMVALAALVILEGWLASHYLGIISLSSRYNKQRLNALREASVFRLRRLAAQADREIIEMFARIEDVASRASKYPDLLESASFKRAVLGLDFKKAEKMIEQTRRALEYAAEGEVRRRNREQGRMESLVLEGRFLGLSDDMMYSMNPISLRDLIEQTKEKNGLRERARLLGCTTFIENTLDEGKLPAANVFLIRANSLVTSSRAFGAEMAVRELICYGNLAGAEKLIAGKKDEVAFAALKQQMEGQIQELRETSRPDMRRRLDAVCSTVYNSREFRQALHEFQVAIQNCCKA